MTISGSASVSGVGLKTPTGIKFTSSNRVQYYAIMNSGGQKAGTYNIQLPNGKQYSVQITYGGPFGALGSCLADILKLNQGPGKGNLTMNFSC